MNFISFINSGFVQHIVPFEKHLNVIQKNQSLRCELMVSCQFQIDFFIFAV